MMQSQMVLRILAHDWHWNGLSIMGPAPNNIRQRLPPLQSRIAAASIAIAIVLLLLPLIPSIVPSYYAASGSFVLTGIGSALLSALMCGLSAKKDASKRARHLVLCIASCCLALLWWSTVPKLETYL